MKWSPWSKAKMLSRESKYVEHLKILKEIKSWPKSNSSTSFVSFFIVLIFYREIGERRQNKYEAWSESKSLSLTKRVGAFTRAKVITAERRDQSSEKCLRIRGCCRWLRHLESNLSRSHLQGSKWSTYWQQCKHCDYRPRRLRKIYFDRPLTLWAGSCQ